MGSVVKQKSSGQLGTLLHIRFQCSWSTWRFLFCNTSCFFELFNQCFRAL
jgi:hypothetical protein